MASLKESQNGDSLQKYLFQYLIRAFIPIPNDPMAAAKTY